MKTIFISKQSNYPKFLPIVFIIVFIIIDQLTKYLALLNLKPITSKEVVKDFFYLTFVENRGAAFGMFQGATIIFVIIAMFVVLTSIYFYDKPPKINRIRNFTRYNDFNSFKSVTDKHGIIWKISIVLLVSGAIGNMIDRICRGYVVDMLHFVIMGKDFAVFNIADIYVCLGTLLLSIMILFSED